MSEVVRKSINEFFEGQDPYLVFVKTSSSLFAIWLATYVFSNAKEVKQSLLKGVFSTLKAIPGVEGQIKKETAKAVDHLKAQFQTGEADRYLEIPAQGIPYEEVLSKMRAMKDSDYEKYKDGKVSGCIYLGDEAHTKFLNEAYSLFSISNPLHPEVFPSVKKFEAEVIRMTVNLMHGDEVACGAMTSGGTESILMAVKAYKDACKHKTKAPELVAAVSAHAAFDKACDYFGIKLVHIPLDSDMRVDTIKLRKAINRNTIAIVGSAPGFPHGIIDPIPELAQIAQAHNVGLHVDTCLGGFVLPFAQELGYDIPVFDFRLPGVTSMSADVHKYGFTPKGTSVVLYRTQQLRSHMYFIAENWPGGIYASPTIAGSRPGGLIAGAWASLVAIGKNGYLQYIDGIMKTAQEIIAGIREIPELAVVGKPTAMVVAFESKVLDVYRVNAGMSKRGWNLNSLQYPSSVHLCVTAKQIGKAQAFLQDLRDSVAEVRANPDKFKESTAAMYGIAAAIPDRTVVRDLASSVIDVLLDP